MVWQRRLQERRCSACKRSDIPPQQPAGPAPAARHSCGSLRGSLAVRHGISCSSHACTSEPWCAPGGSTCACYGPPVRHAGQHATASQASSGPQHGRRRQPPCAQHHGPACAAGRQAADAHGAAISRPAGEGARGSGQHSTARWSAAGQHAAAADAPACIRAGVCCRARGYDAQRERRVPGHSPAQQRSRT